MPDYLGDDQRKTKDEEKDEGPIRGNVISKKNKCNVNVNS